MVAQPISPIAGLSPLPDRQEDAFAAAIERASEGGNADSRPLPSGVVIVAALTADTTGAPAVGAMRISPDGSGDGVVTQVSLSEVQTGNASDATAGGSSAVVVTTDATGEFTQTTVVTVTDNEDGNGSQIAINISTADGTDTVTTVNIDSSMLDIPTLPGDARVAVGVLSKDSISGEPRSLILVVPTDATDGSDSTFSIVAIELSETVDPASAFANYRFSGLNGGSLASSFGGAVAIEVNGARQVFWLNAGRNISPSFTGQVEADYGIINPTNGSSTGAVAGIANKITLIFDKGALIGQKDSCGNHISSLDTFVRDMISTQPLFSQFKTIISSAWQTVLTRDTMVYALSNVERSRVFSRIGNQNEADNIAVRQAVQLQQALIEPAAFREMDR